MLRRLCSTTHLPPYVSLFSSFWKGMYQSRVSFQNSSDGIVPGQSPQKVSDYEDCKHVCFRAINAFGSSVSLRGHENSAYSRRIPERMKILHTWRLTWPHQLPTLLSLLRPLKQFRRTTSYHVCCFFCDLFLIFFTAFIVLSIFKTFCSVSFCYRFNFHRLKFIEGGLCRCFLRSKLVKLAV